MDEKTDLSPPTELLDTSTAVSFAEGIVSEVTGTSTGTNDVDGDREIQPIISNEPSEASEPNEGGNEANNLLSELNDVSLTAGNSDADTFLDSLTSDNTDTPEVPPSQEESSQDTESTTALELPMEVTPPSEDNITLKEEKNVEEEEQKDPVCSLEEELQRMHEGDDQLLSTEPEFSKPKDEEKMVKETVGENSDTTNNAPIMRDSELEEMLSADEVLQDSTSIKAAQDEIKRLDVLVCGTCHEVFNFVEEFQEHKTNNCTQKSNLIPICEFESKPQVWGYILWKNKKSKGIKEEEISPWQIYKNWCSLAPDDQNAWISAGQTLQYHNKIGSAKLTEVKLHSKIPKDDEKDPLSLDNFGESNKENSSLDTTKSPLLEVNDPNSNRAMRTVQTAQKCEFVVEKIVAKRFNPKRKTWEYQIKWENFPSEDNTWEPIGNLNHCKQMVEEFEEQLKKLKAEKAKQQAANLAKNSPKPKPIILNSPSGSKGLNQNRPQRTSKQKALDQVKAWCGNISDEDNVDSLGYKRSRSPDSDESYEKRMKLDENSEDSESDVKPKVTYRKIAPKPTSSQPIQILKNGIGKNSPLPQNILIPDANGVVRINQKQLPSLSTGVYIMSKTAGIIKLDSNTSKVATSGGQTIVKVAPKIGQTQIKIMKKDGTSTQQIVQMSSKNVASNSKGMKTHLARAKKIVTELKPVQVAKKTEVLKKPVILNTKESEKKMVVKKILDGKQTTKFSKGLNSSQSGQENRDDDSDDGLEELPFPDEIKVPEPEETEESEFTLDPTTGKIAGVEYPDVPDPEPIEEPSKSELSLDNIVKLAAADITEEDLKNEPQDAMELEMHHLETENDEVEKLKMPIKTELESQKRFVSSPMKQVVKMSVTPRKVAAYPTSILNKALTQGPQVVRRNVTGQQRVQQRVLNQSVARSSQMTSPVVRQLNTYVRTKPVAPKPKFNLPGESKFIRPNRDSSPTKVYSYSRSLVQNQGSQRKIGSTTIRSSSMPLVNSPQSKTQSRLVKTSTGVMQRIVSPMKKESSGMVVRGQPEKIERKLVQNKPKTVISMPSLISDDELLIPNKATPQQKGKVAALIQSSEQTQEYHDQQQIAAVVQEANIGEAVAQEQQAVAALTPDMSSFTLADNENPIFITGDDGTVYQVAGQNEQGQTILLTQGSDGQQQCLLVTNEVAEAMDTSLTEEAQQPEISMPEINTDVTEPLSVKTDPTENNDQVVAQVVRAEPPSPGGTHKVVVMLPDGNLMVTQVSPEEYASLELE